MGIFGWSRRLRIAILVVVGVAVGWWVVHPRPSDEELIGELVWKAEHGVETKSVEEIMGCVSSEYEGEGGMRREDVWRAAQQWVRSPARADVAIEKQEVRVDGPRASGQFWVLVTLEEEGVVVRGLKLVLSVEFEKERRGLGKVWLVRSMRGFDPEGLAEELL